MRAIARADSSDCGLIERNRLLRSRGLTITWAFALSRIRAERKLRDQKDTSPDILHRAIRNLVFVVKHTKACHFVADIGQINLVIALFNAQKHDETALDLADDFSFHLDRGARGTLNNRSHDCIYTPDLSIHAIDVPDALEFFEVTDNDVELFGIRHLKRHLDDITVVRHGFAADGLDAHIQARNLL